MPSRRNERVKVLKTTAKAMAVICVRNTVIEDYHARGSLSQEDMRIFNIQVVNHLYTWLYIQAFGSEEQVKALAVLVGMFVPYGWDEPRLDRDTLKALGMIAARNVSEKIAPKPMPEKGKKTT
jgi:hypothetical protein